MDSVDVRRRIINCSFTESCNERAEPLLIYRYTGLKSRPGDQTSWLLRRLVRETAWYFKSGHDHFFLVHYLLIILSFDSTVEYDYFHNVNCLWSDSPHWRHEQRKVACAIREEGMLNVWRSFFVCSSYNHVTCTRSVKLSHTAVNLMSCCRSHSRYNENCFQSLCHG